jgi:hypothetical protein
MTASCSTRTIVERRARPVPGVRHRAWPRSPSRSCCGSVRAQAAPRTGARCGRPPRAIWSTCRSCGSGPSHGAELALGDSVAGRIATSWFGLVVAGGGLISAWGGIALVRRMPATPLALGGRVRRVTDGLPARGPDRRRNRARRLPCIRGAVARNPGQPGSGRLAALAAPVGAGDPPRRIAPCRRCFGSPVLSAAGSGRRSARRAARPLDPHQDDRRSCRGGVHRAQPPDAAGGARSAGRRNRARSYAPAEGSSRVRGLPLDPEPQSGRPFLFTISGLAEEADAGIPALPP